MSDQGQPDRWMSPVAPPTTPTAQPVQQPQSAWPTTIGVIAIVLGGLAILNGLWGAAAPAFIDKMTSMMPEEQRSTMDAMKQHMGWTVAVSLFGALVALILLVAGIGMIRRRRWAITASRVWAVLKILFAVASSVLGYLVVRVQIEQMESQVQGMPAWFGNALPLVSIAFGLLWYMAFPVFLLIWLARRKIRQEYESWS